MIRNGVLEEIEEIIKENEKNNNYTGKEKNILDIIDVPSSNSNSNSSTKYHINRTDPTKKQCQNKACESQNKKISKVESAILLKKNSIKWLCKVCLDAYKQNQFCYYCYFIYHSSTNDKKSWIQCDFCCCWVIFLLTF